MNNIDVSEAKETSTHLLMKLNAKSRSLSAWPVVGNGEENSNLGAGGISCYVCWQIKSWAHPSRKHSSLGSQIRRVTELV